MKYLTTGAVISDCLTFRYRLWRLWDDDKPRVTFAMLNPSKAAAVLDDPTIRKCVGFAQRLGYGGIEVVNLFAYRATDPADLRRAGFPVGPENDAHILAACTSATDVICAWGANAEHPAAAPRARAFRHLLSLRPVRMLTLATTRAGTPSHPLMLPYSCAPKPWAPAC